jgi:RHS repeat-associated protein
MGTPRRVLVRGTLAQHRRLVMDAWGQARLYPGVNTPPNSPSSSVPSATDINVYLPHRLPGQLQGPGEPVVENRYRYYVPTLGQYLTPDPMHQASVMSPGPQAYAYANGNPVKFSDPDGQVTYDRESYRKNCDGCCEDYDPEAGRATALLWAAKPRCRAAWARLFPNTSLYSLITGPGPTVAFGGVRWEAGGHYDFLSPQTIRLTCNIAKKASRRAHADALIHELVHYAQYQEDFLRRVQDKLQYSQETPSETSAQLTLNDCASSDSSP